MNEPQITEQRTLPERYVFLDTLRGLTMLSMILYHFLWDLVYIAGIDLPWYRGEGAYIWQQSICQTFIILSGFCWSFGKKPLRRGLIVFWGGGLITLVTMLLMPQNQVLFGVLTFIGSAMLLMIPLNKLLKKATNPVAITLLMGLFIALFILFKHVSEGTVAGIALPDFLYSNLFTAYLGFPPTSFYSTDYFALLPWFFLFVTGYLFHKLCDRCDWLKASFLRKDFLPPFTFIGRHSLLIYMLHQPVLYSITMLIIFFTK